jgi:hypothetical protein
MKQRTPLTLENEANFHWKETRASKTRTKETRASDTHPKETRASDTHPIRPHARLRDFPHRAAASILNRAANLAIFIEVALGALAGKLFSLLPRSFREKLQRVNGEYLKYRNRLLRIDPSINNPSINNASLDNASLNNPNSNGSIAERKHDHIDKCLVIESEEISDEQIDEQRDKDRDQHIDKDRDQHVDKDRDKELALQRGDVPGWVLVVLMTTGLVTALWTIAAPRLSQILRNSLDSMNGIR